MKTYTYTHPTSQHVTIAGTDVYFEKGKSYELPSENAYIREMIAQGYLMPTAPQKQSKQSKRA